MNLWNLSFYFLSGSIGVSLFGWVLSLSPAFIRFSTYGIALSILAIGFGFFCDDPISESLGISVGQWYSILIGSAVALLCGIAVLAGVLTNG